MKYGVIPFIWYPWYWTTNMVLSFMQCHHRNLIWWFYTHDIFSQKITIIYDVIPMTSTAPSPSYMTMMLYPWHPWPSRQCHLHRRRESRCREPLGTFGVPPEQNPSYPAPLLIQNMRLKTRKSKSRWKLFKNPNWKHSRNIWSPAWAESGFRAVGPKSPKSSLLS